MISPRHSEVQIYDLEFKTVCDLINSDITLASIMSDRLM